MTTPPVHSRNEAFSLVEVVLALGILTFGVVPLMGLLSIGLQQKRENIDRTVEAQILSWAQGSIRLRTQGGPANYSGTFDENGIAAAGTEAVFSAEMVPRAAASLPGGSATLKSWKLEIRSSKREEVLLGQYVVWEAQ